MIVSKEDVLSRIRPGDYWRLLTQATKLFLMQILGLFVVPVALLFAKNNKLPEWAYWWDNMNSGIDGNPGWAATHCNTPGSFWCRYKWLALRNPARNYSLSIGMPFKEVAEVYVTEKHPVDMHCRSIYALCIGKDGKRYTMFFISIRLPKGWALVCKFGWKLWDVEKDVLEGKDGMASFVFYPQLKHRCEGVD